MRQSLKSRYSFCNGIGFIMVQRKSDKLTMWNKRIFWWFIVLFSKHIIRYEYLFELFHSWLMKSKTSMKRPLSKHCIIHWYEKKLWDSNFKYPFLFIINHKYSFIGLQWFFNLFIIKGILLDFACSSFQFLSARISSFFTS